MEKEHACQDIGPELVALLDGQLDGSLRLQVEAHLEDCPACRAELADLERALGVVDSLPASEPAPGLQARFQARFEKERAGGLRGLWAWLRRPVPALALGSGLAALVLVAVLVAQPGSLTPNQDELAIASHLDLLTDYEAIENLDLLQDLDVLEALGDEV